MRGGRRPGGGRKPIPPEQKRIVLSCRVKPETFDAICREAGQGSIGRLLDRIFNSEIQNDRPLPEDTVLFNKGVAEGKRLMMEDAVKWLVDDDYHEASEKGRFILGSVGLGYNGYYIPYLDLLKLPKED